MANVGALTETVVERVEWRKYVAFLVMVLGMFMAMLDIQIVSGSFYEIQAGLAASSNEVSWIQTSYLTAEIVMIPLSGYLSRRWGPGSPSPFRPPASPPQVSCAACLLR